MNAAWVLPLLVWGPAGSPMEPARHPAVVTARLKADVRAAMAVSHASKRPDLEAVAPDLLTLYTSVRDSENLPAAEKKRLLRLLGTRLHEVDTKLSGRLARIDKSARTQVLAQRLPQQQQAQGTNTGSLRPRAQELIDLIRETIDPDTWDIRGGEGSIYYFHPVLGLVVRQTAEVHETVGETLRNVR